MVFQKNAQNRDKDPQAAVAVILVQNAIAQVRNNNTREAISKRSATRCAFFEKAQRFNPDVDLIPYRSYRGWPSKDKNRDKDPQAAVAVIFVDNAIAKAKNNDIETAISKRSATRCALFQKAQRFNPDVDLFPTTKENIDRNPSIAAHLYRAIEYYNRRQSNSALADFDKIIEINPNYAYAYWLKGIILLESGEKEKARNSLKIAAKLYKKQVIKTIEELDSK